MTIATRPNSGNSEIAELVHERIKEAVSRCGDVTIIARDEKGNSFTYRKYSKNNGEMMLVLLLGLLFLVVVVALGVVVWAESCSVEETSALAKRRASESAARREQQNKAFQALLESVDKDGVVAKDVLAKLQRQLRACLDDTTVDENNNVSVKEASTTSESSR